MNREIKFRGKRMDNGQWVEGYYFVDLENKLHYIMLNERRNTPEDWMVKSLIIDPETVGQFTGLTNRDGSEIYEGDVIKMPVGSIVYTGKIVFGKITLGFGIHVKYKHHEYTDPQGKKIQLFRDKFYRLRNTCEIIGNIHDNPELLNQ